MDQITLQLRPEFPTESFSTALVGLRRQGYQPVSAFIASLPSGPYRRLPRLVDWTQRIITARHVGFDVVYVPQTWTVRETPHGIVTEPTERYILLRTLADVLGDSMPDRRFSVTSGATCLTFQGENGMIAAMWDEHAPDNAQPHAIQLGRASRQIDLWGQAIPLKRNELGQQIVQLSAMPILVDQIEPWLVDFRTSMKRKPARRVRQGHTRQRRFNSADQRSDAYLNRPAVKLLKVRLGTKAEIPVGFVPTPSALQLSNLKKLMPTSSPQV